MEYKGFKIIMNSDESFMIINTHTQKNDKTIFGIGWLHACIKKRK